MVFVYITCQSEDEAKKLGKALLTERLAACVNIFPILSIYRQDENLNEVSEHALIVKTIESKVQQVEDIVRTGHSYKIPFLGTFSLFRINREYKEWMNEQIA